MSGDFDIKLLHYDRLQKELKEFSAGFREKVMRNAMRAGARHVAKIAKLNARGNDLYDTGSLIAGISSIALRTKPGDPRVISKVGVRHGRYVKTKKGGYIKGVTRNPHYWWYFELGTERHSPRPFLVPTMQMTAQRVTEVIRENAEKAIDRELKKRGVD